MDERILCQPCRHHPGQRRGPQRAQDLATYLKIALESRVIIGRAKGIVMEGRRGTADAALQGPASASRVRMLSFVDVAQDVLDTGT
ncbi:MAG: ANTAR domain-containing protein [Acidimicrobiales bacterium]